MLKLEDIHKCYQLGSQTIDVLRGIDLRVESGEFVSIMGASGSGKSTLLNVLGILDSYDRGNYWLDGKLIKQVSEAHAAELRSRHIGFIFQSFNLLSFKSAQENVALPLYYRGIKRKQRNHSALQLLERMGLADRAHHLPSELSGGQRQRVAIARALITEPNLILADEPTGALDSATSQEVMAILRQLNGDGKTILLVTHERDIAAQTGRTIHIRDGRIIDANMDLNNVDLDNVDLDNVEPR